MSWSNATLIGIVLKCQGFSEIIVGQHRCCRDSLFHRVKPVLLVRRPVPRDVVLQQVEEEVHQFGNIWQEFSQIVHHPEKSTLCLWLGPVSSIALMDDTLLGSMLRPSFEIRCPMKVSDSTFVSSFALFSLMAFSLHRNRNLFRCRSCPQCPCHGSLHHRQCRRLQSVFIAPRQASSVVFG